MFSVCSGTNVYCVQEFLFPVHVQIKGMVLLIRT